MELNLAHYREVHVNIVSLSVSQDIGCFDVVPTKNPVVRQLFIKLGSGKDLPLDYTGSSNRLRSVQRSNAYQRWCDHQQNPFLYLPIVHPSSLIDPPRWIQKNKFTVM